MEFFIIIGVCFVLYFMNKMALKTAINSQNEDLAREIKRKITQNQKLDELYGRKTGDPIQQMAKAIYDVEKSKKEI